MIKAVLFDLDDTLSDHQYSRRCGLHVFQERWPELAQISIAELERAHEDFLQANYFATLDGTMSSAAARVERVRRLCERYGRQVGTAELQEVTDLYRRAYEANRRAVPGAKELVERCKKRYTVGVVTNGASRDQWEKIRLCELEGCLDFVVISEEAGFRKPDPRIFLEALRQAGVQPDAAVVIGDSWENDVMPSRALGMPHIWLNRYGFTPPFHEGIVEVFSLEPVDEMMQRLAAIDTMAVQFKKEMA